MKILKKSDITKGNFLTAASTLKALVISSFAHALHDGNTAILKPMIEASEQSNYLKAPLNRGLKAFFLKADDDKLSTKAKAVLKSLRTELGIDTTTALTEHSDTVQKRLINAMDAILWAKPATVASNQLDKMLKFWDVDGGLAYDESVTPEIKELLEQVHASLTALDKANAYLPKKGVVSTKQAIADKAMKIKHDDTPDQTAEQDDVDANAMASEGLPQLVNLVKGIGTATANKLKALNILTVNDLAETDVNNDDVDFNIDLYKDNATDMLLAS